MVELIESIRSYVHSTAHHALLLTGEWGSGKTYFVKNTLQYQLTENGIKCLYVSLNGIKNTNEIIRQIIAAKFNISQNIIIGSSFLKSILDLSSAIPGLEKLKNVLSIPPNDNLIKIFDFSKCFIIFDDLERISSKYKLSDFFGFINTEFVEHNGYKVLFIANENEIDDKKYPVIKEKLIGYTYKYDASIPEFFDSYINSLDKSIIWFYNDYKSIILEYLRKYNIINLRTIFSAFENLNIIINTLSREAITHHYISILVLVLSVTNEIKLGKITTEDIVGSKGLKHLTNTVNSKRLHRAIIERNQSSGHKNDDENIAECYEEYFTTTYLDNKPDKFVFYDCIFKLLLTGYVNPSEVLREIVLKPELPGWREAEDIMIRYMEYDEDTVKNNVSLVLEYAKKGEYPPLSYGYIYHWLSMFANNKIINVRSNSLIKILKNGFALSVKRNGLNHESLDRTYYAVANTKDNPLSVHINKKVDQLKKAKEIDNYNHIFNILGDEHNLYEYFERNNARCIFDKVNIDKLFTTLRNSNSVSIFNFTQNINHRYNFKNIFDYYMEDLDGITKLISLLEKPRISKEKYPLKVMALRYLREDLESIKIRLMQQ